MKIFFKILYDNRLKSFQKLFFAFHKYNEPNYFNPPRVTYLTLDFWL